MKQTWLHSVEEHREAPGSAGVQDSSDVISREAMRFPEPSRLFKNECENESEVCCTS